MEYFNAKLSDIRNQDNSSRLKRLQKNDLKVSKVATEVKRKRVPALNKSPEDVSKKPRQPNRAPRKTLPAKGFRPSMPPVNSDDDNENEEDHDEEDLGSDVPSDGDDKLVVDVVWVG